MHVKRGKTNEANICLGYRCIGAPLHVVMQARRALSISLLRAINTKDDGRRRCREKQRFRGSRRHGITRQTRSHIFPFSSGLFLLSTTRYHLCPWLMARRIDRQLPPMIHHGHGNFKNKWNDYAVYSGFVYFSV